MHRYKTLNADIMDYLRSMFKPAKDTTSLTYNEQGQTTPQQGTEKKENTTENRLEAKALEKLDVIGENVGNVLKRYIPIADDDCLSCKLIGTSVAWGSGIFILAAIPRAVRSQTGIAKKLMCGSYISFACTLFLIGSARLFNLSLFQRTEDKKSIFEMTKDDFQQFKEFFQNKTDGKR